MCGLFTRYDIMYSCWRADPLDRPLFAQLREMLEKLTEKLPESSRKDDIIYINTSFPEEDPDGDVFSSSPSCSRQVEGSAVVTADVHGSMEGDDDDDGDRYVVVISSASSVRSPAMDAPLLAGDAGSSVNGDVVTDAPRTNHSSSDTARLL